MGTAPGKVIRSLRQALDMTQAEFARAAGWSPSTISSWERGTAKPSRLAFKTILAFAEERGVRYQPKSDAGAQAPGTAPSSTLPVLRLSSRLPAAALTLDAVRPSSSTMREESFGSRRWTEIAAGTGATDFALPNAARAERPEWQVEAHLKLKIGTGTGAERLRRTGNERQRRTGLFAASLAALAIGVGAGILLRSGSGTARSVERPSAQVEPATARVPEPVAARAPEPAPPVEADEIALAAIVAPLPGPPLANPAADRLTDAAATAPRPMPAPAHARLESIVALDGVRRASFRVGDRSIALVEGDEIGGRAVVHIANDEVMLAGGGTPQRVRLGFETPLE